MWWKEKRRSVPAEVIAHEIGVLGEVDGLQRQAAEALAAIDGLVLRRGSAPAAGLAAPFRHGGRGASEKVEADERRGERCGRARG